MEETVIIDFLKSKARGYIKVAKDIVNEMKSLSEVMFQYNSEIQEKLKDKNLTYDKVIDQLKSYDVNSMKFHFYTQDIEKYMLKVNTISDLLQGLGENLTLIDEADEESKAVLEGSKMMMRDSEAFMFTSINGVVQPIDDKKFNEQLEMAKSRETNPEYFKRIFEKLKESVTQ